MIQFKSISKAVTLAATPEPISATDLVTSSVLIQAKTTNTSQLTIGDSANQFHELDAGESVSLSDILIPRGEDTFNLKDIYVNVGTNGEGVNVIYSENIS